MEWTDDVTPGAWIGDRLDASSGVASMHVVVPRGFDAYVRIFHPAHRDRPVGETWPALPYGRHRREWDAFQARNPEIVDERVTWADTAAAMGTTMHPLAQWERLIAPGRIVENEDGPRDAAGWRYSEPQVGGLEPDHVSAVARHLAAHTSTPDAGFVAIWEGFGGLVGFMGETPSRAFLQIGGADSSELSRHNDMIGRSTSDPFNSVFAPKTWQEGILSREISESARLELPMRAYVLFRGGATELADPDWVLRAPWRDVAAEAHGFAPSAQAPNLVWPEDRAWTLVSDIDVDSTIIGGPSALIRAILDDPSIEALQVREGADLSWDADDVNR